MKGTRSIIEIEEIDSNPDDSYFKLPDKYKDFWSMGQWHYNNFLYGGDINSFFDEVQ